MKKITIILLLLSFNLYSQHNPYKDSIIQNFIKEVNLLRSDVQTYLSKIDGFDFGYDTTTSKIDSVHPLKFDYGLSVDAMKKAKYLSDNQISGHNGHKKGIELVSYGYSSDLDSMVYYDLFSYLKDDGNSRDDIVFEYDTIAKKNGLSPYKGFTYVLSCNDLFNELIPLDSSLIPYYYNSEKDYINYLKQTNICEPLTMGWYTTDSIYASEMKSKPIYDINKCEDAYYNYLNKFLDVEYGHRKALVSKKYTKIGYGYHIKETSNGQFLIDTVVYLD